MFRPERRDDGSPSRPKDSRELRERRRAVDEVHGETEHGPVEPAVLERQRLGPPELEADAPSGTGACLGEHLGRGVDSPQPRPALGQRVGEPPGSAPDVENAPAEQIAFLPDRV